MWRLCRASQSQHLFLHKHRRFLSQYVVVWKGAVTKEIHAQFCDDVLMLRKWLAQLRHPDSKERLPLQVWQLGEPLADDRLDLETAKAVMPRLLADLEEDLARATESRTYWNDRLNKLTQDHQALKKRLCATGCCSCCNPT